MAWVVEIGSPRRVASSTVKAAPVETATAKWPWLRTSGETSPLPEKDLLSSSANSNAATEPTHVAVVPAMMDARWGRIINVSSGTHVKGRPNYLHYITSKSAMIGMTRSMARELGDYNVTVHLFWPGAVETEIERPSVSGAQFQAIAQQQCIKRPATMDEYAGFMLFLCSDDAEYMTGQAMAANGGVAFT